MICGQAVGAGLDFKGWFKWLFRNKEDLRRLYCSELCCKALQIIERIDNSTNPSEITPSDLSKFDIYNQKEIILDGSL